MRAFTGVFRPPLTLTHPQSFSTLSPLISGCSVVNRQRSIIITINLRYHESTLHSNIRCYLVSAPLPPSIIEEVVVIAMSSVRVVLFSYIINVQGHLPTGGLPSVPRNVRVYNSGSQWRRIWASKSAITAVAITLTTGLITSIQAHYRRLVRRYIAAYDRQSLP